LPLLTPVILFNLVMQMISGFLVFTQAYLVTGGRPLDSTLFYALYLYLRAFEVHEMGYGSAMAWVLLLIIAFFTALVFRSSTGWVYYESAGGRA
jgi:multiple sugar transport system permease protein